MWNTVFFLFSQTDLKWEIDQYEQTVKYKEKYEQAKTESKIDIGKDMERLTQIDSNENQLFSKNIYQIYTF